jgi:hypothetical protein
MICTGLGSSVSERRINDPVTMTSCNSVSFDEAVLGACCAWMGAANNAATAAAAMGVAATRVIKKIE